MTFNGIYSMTIQSNGFYAVAFYWALAGAILSFLSRFGGVMTFVGVIAFMEEPYTFFGSSRPGLGVLVALGGAIFAIVGLRWSIPRGIVKRREMLGGVLYTGGFLIVLTLVISSIAYGGPFSLGSSQLVVAAPLLLVGVLMTGLGLKMFLSPDRRGSSLKVIGSGA
jgi:hypothetical protein